MASISHRPNGHRWVTFTAPSGRRQTIRLGTASEAQAQAFKTRVERLLIANKLGEPPDPATVEWLAVLSDKLHKKLARCGLVGGRGARTVGELIAWFEQNRSNKDSTAVNERVVARGLVRFFTAERRLNQIDHADANSYRKWLSISGALKGGPLAPTTASRVCRRARAMFALAAKRKWILENPFAEQRGWIDTNPERDLYISAEEVEAVIAVMKDPAMQLVLTLVRYVGLRCPSEIVPLQWGWVDWDKSTLRIKAVKTERYDGKGTRVAPLNPIALKRLGERFDSAKPGTTLIFPTLQEITRTGIANRVETACRRIGIALWKKPFINLRASAEHDWLRAHPIDAVCGWTGHSPEISLRHYRRIAKDRTAEEAALHAKNPQPGRVKK